MQKKVFFIFLTLTLIHLKSLAQDTTQTVFTRFLEVGVSANSYRGDLSSSYGLWSSAFQLGIKFNKNKRLNSHFNLAIGAVRGQNFNYFFSEEATPNDFFRADFVAINYDLQYNIVRKPNWVLYVSQGIGFMRFAPKDQQGENLQDILTSRAINETYNNVSAIFPTSFGLMYWLKNGYGVGTQLTFTNPTTDYLDNISVWGNRTGSDNMLMWRFSVLAPLQKKKVRRYIPIDQVVPIRTRGTYDLEYRYEEEKE